MPIKKMPVKKVVKNTPMPKQVSMPKEIGSLVQKKKVITAEGYRRKHLTKQKSR
jgi:hypothetical protein